MNDFRKPDPTRVAPAQNPPPPQSVGEAPENVYFSWLSPSALTPLGLLLGRIGQILVQVVTFRALTTLLSSQEVGRYYLLTSVQAWFSLFFLAGPALYVARKFLDWRREDAHARALLSFVLFVLGLSLLCIPVAWLLLRWGWISSPTPAATVLLIAAWLFVASLASQASSLLNLLERRFASVILVVGASLLGLLAACFAVARASPRAESWLSGFTAAYAVVGVIGVLLLIRALGAAGNAGKENVSPSLPSTPDWRPAWDFAWPITLIMALYWAQSQGYRFALSFARGEEQVGLFVIAYSMGASIILVAESVRCQWVLPRFYDRISGATGEQCDEVWQDYVALLVPLFLPLAAFAVFAGPFLLKLLAGPEFQAAAPYALWGGIAESFRMLIVLFFQGAVGRLKTREMLLPHLPAAIIAVGGTYFMGLYGNLHGVGLSLALSYAAVAVLMHLFVNPRLLSRCASTISLPGSASSPLSPRSSPPGLLAGARVSC